MTLTDFLLARIAEDEKAARVAVSIDDPTPDRYGVFGPARVLAECEAKRAIVTLCSASNASLDGAITLSLMTLPYADHPDFREEWRP